MVSSQDSASGPAAPGPYGLAATAYWEAGWRGVLPLPPGRKSPPPDGWTGHAGGWPSRADLQAWIDEAGAGNIALRLPPDVIGLDVDAYGGKAGAATLAGLEARLGPLPPTWSSTARLDGVSGIRLFRVPTLAGGGALNWAGEAGPNIEIIQFGHRYMVVAPSTNPDAGGAAYHWLAPAGAGRAQVLADVPRVEWLAELPAAWVDALSSSMARRDAAELDDEEARAWLTWCRGPGDPNVRDCPIVERTAHAATLDLQGQSGSRHETARDAAHALARLGGEGHAGVAAGLNRIRIAFLAAVEGDRGRDGPGEWGRLLVGAVRLAAASDPVPRDGCDCAVWAGEGLGFDPGFPGSGGADGEGSGGGTETVRTDVNPIEPAGRVGTAATGGRVAAMRAALLTPRELVALPPPRPLIQGLLYLDTLAWLIGKAGDFKSFLCWTWAGHVGRGLPWAGRRVRAGSVLYLMAEGRNAAGLRINAWEKHYGEMIGVLTMPYAVQARGEHWGTLVELAGELAPSLIVVDTQARHSVGFRESDNSDMGEFIGALDRLRRASGACVLTVHHIGRAGEDARGASAIDGAQDTELKISRVGGDKSYVTRLDVEKQKDGDESASITLQMVKVDLGHDPDTGDELSSLVAMPPVFQTPPARPWVEDLGPNQAKIVDIMVEHRGAIGATYAEAYALLRERFGPMPKSSFSTAWNQLVQKSRLVRIEGTQRYIVSSDMPVQSNSYPQLPEIIQKLNGDMG